MSGSRAWWFVVLTSATVGCLSFGPSDVPAIDVVGRATLASGSAAVGLRITGVTYEAALCGLPGPARELRESSAVTDATGAYRLHVLADSAGPRCVAVGAQLGGGVGAGVTQVAEARTRAPFQVINVDLVLR